ncbi:MAG: HlyD family efflux transporter periplasmic adaptor subunit [Acidobacteria bacterium]|nr:HlyD family efflux transporter periplasmic adaptor subunit [Acidobacteriota bacterium]
MSAYTNPAPSPVQPPEKLAPVAVPPEPKGGSSWKGWLVAALIAGGAWAGYEFGYKRSIAEKSAQSTTAAIPVVKAAQGKLEVRARISGASAAREYANITAPMIRGPEGNRPMVLLKLAPSGALVKKGDLIASIDGQTLQDHIDDVKDTVETAEADVRKRKAELEIDWKNMQLTVSVAKADLDKARLDARASEVRTEVERMLLQLNFEEADARYKQLQSDIENTRKRQAAEIKILELTLERHKRHLGRHAIDLERFSIHAAIDGLVVYQTVWGGSSMRQIEMGDQVAAGQPFMKVVNPKSMMLEAKINQAESDRFRLGMPAEMKLDAFNGMTLKGHIFSIGAIAAGGWRQNFFIRNVPVRVAFDTVDTRLIPDLSGSADVLLESSADNSVIVPLGAVVDEEGKSYVQVKTAQGFDKREVKTGLRNDTHAVIASGLDAGVEIRANY